MFSDKWRKFIHSIIVPKEKGVGYIFNFDKPIAVLIMVVFAVLLTIGLSVLTN